MTSASMLERVVAGLSHCGVCALDARGRVTSANVAAAQLVGRDAEALVGMPYAALWGEAGADAALAAAAAAGLHEVVGWRALAGGRRAHLRQILIAARPGSTTDGYLLLAHELAPGHLPEGVAGRVRTERLDALARLGGSLAHEFNNVTQVLNTAVEILYLKLGRADAEVTRYLDMLRRGTERASSASHRLLVFAGGQMLSPAPADANDVVLRSAELLRQQLPPGVEIETALHPDAGVVFVDVAALLAALRRLGDNASEAMGGKGRIRLSTELGTLVEDDRACVVIAMRDEGPGMPPEVKARAGEPYFTTKGIGHGQGLAQAYGFARQSGGQLEIDSAPGAGTTVRLLLPRMQPAHQSGTGDKAARDAPSLAGVRVFVVEDEMLVAMLVEDLLMQLGCEVVTIASNIEDALERASRETFDVGLLDVNLQSEPVYPVARALTARGLPFVFMSGGGHLEPGWDDRPVIQKPFQLAQVRRRLQQALAPARRA